MGPILAAGLAVALAAAPAQAEVKVAVTIKPIHALVSQVMEGVATPTLLVQGAASPHTYALKPSDAAALHHADVFFRVSENVEPFTRKIVEALPSSVRTVTLADAPGVTHLPIRTGETFELHDHAHEGGTDDGDHAHDHDDHDYDDHAPGTTDGHVWLDPENARKMVAEIARVLAEASPADAETFKANAARTDVALAALETEITGDLAPLKGMPFVVFHDAFQYFEQRFGLAAVGSITVSPEHKPSAKRLTEIRRKLASLKAACVFSEPQFQAKLVAAVTEGTTARAGTLDPEGALVEPGPAAYATLLRNLASGLKSCLLAPG
ncbi:MAG: zinc ABC transporter substrate-binding protein [Hyphomicrobium sp.]|uniref:zinc ABC transporter substrate-binding protein n=1 Tax=Hyphomicrobium sp. TaxID=82 RepID=UPI003D14741A